MRKHVCLLITLWMGISTLFAQDKVTVSLSNRLIGELFSTIENQTAFRIYSLPIDTDSLRITVSATNEAPATVLRNALEGTSFSVTEFEQTLFVLKGKEMITSLPDGYHPTAPPSSGEGYDMTDLTLMGSKRDQKASSENKVYEIGDPATGKTGRVTVSGVVTDFKSGEPMIGVALFVRDPFIATTTDVFGFYSLQLPVGRNDLNISGMGMKETKRQLLVYTEGKLDIELEEQIYTLKEVSISSERIANVRNTTLGMERLQVKDIKNIPTAFGEMDILRVVMSLPGVKAVGEASSGFNVRGGATDQNLILFNDGTVYNPTHLFGFFSAFNPDVVKDMELYKSSIPAKYGGRISSILDINSREGNKKKFQGSASIGLLTSRLTLEGPLFSDKTSFIVGGRTTYSDWILKQLPEKSGYSEGTAGFYDFNTTVNHKFDERNNLYLNGYYSADRFSFNAFEKYAYRNASASVKWRHIFNNRFTGVFTGGYDHYDYNTQNTEIPVAAFKLGFGINQYFGKGDFVWYINDKHTIDFGLSSIHYNLNPGEYLPNSSESMVREERMQTEKALESAIYLGDRWDITSALSVNAGLRLSIFNAIGPRTYNIYKAGSLPSIETLVETTTESGLFKTYLGPEIRLAARYAFTDDFSAKAGFNTMRQYIHKLSNSTVMSPTDTWKLSDANIKPQTGMQAAFGLYKNFANNTIEASVEAYYKTMSNYLDYRNGAELLMNPHVETDVLDTQGRAYGVEFMLKKTLGKLNGWVSYTYSRTELRQNSPLILDPVNKGDWYPADFDKPHDIKLVGNFKFTHRFSFSTNCDYSTGRPITLPVSKYNYAGGQFVYYSDRNQYRIPNFFRVDASFNIEPSHHLTLLTHSTLSIGVYNLTGRNNAYSVYYVSENGMLKGYKLAIFGAPIPYVSYNIKF